MPALASAPLPATPAAPPSPGRSRLADLPARVAVAVPAAAIAVALVVIGGVAFVAALTALAALAARELCRMLGAAPAPSLIAAVGAGGMIVVAFTAPREALPPALAAACVLAVIGSLVSRDAERRLAGATGAVLAVVWIGVGLAHGVLLRELDHGAGLVIDVMLAVFVGDTAAHLLGSLVGRRPLAPAISPRKTVEGLVAGILAGTAACAVASGIQPWLSLEEGLALGLAVAFAAPLGDLFESLVKRRAAVKDSGRLFGAHGGALDRIDAVLFAAPVGYYVALALV